MSTARLVALALVSTLSGMHAQPATEGDSAGRFLVVSAENAARLEQRLQSAAAEGFRLRVAAEGSDVTGKPRISVLLERSAGNRVAYRVVSCADLDDAIRESLADLGADGYRLLPDGVTARRLRDVWLPDSTYDDQLSLILEKDGEGPRYAFDAIAFGDYEPFYDELARSRSEGHEVVGMWNTGRKLQLVLQKRMDAGADARSPAAAEEHRLLLLATRLALAGKLESAAGDGFRILAAVDPSIVGPPVILLEKSAVPGDLVDYRFMDDLPVKQTRDALMAKLNKKARKGWRVARRGTTAEVITLERPSRESARTPVEYRLLSSRRAPGLAESLEQSVNAGFDPVRLFVEPDETTVLVERVTTESTSRDP